MTRDIGQGGLSGNVLKFIAIVSMTVDHVGAAIIEQGLLHAYDQDRLAAVLSTEQGQAWLLADRVLRIIGRIAFPIFCFLLVQGFFHTGSRVRYLSRLCIFAVVSELPFDLALDNLWFNPGGQNVYFTLAIGVLVMAAQEHWQGQLWLQGAAVLTGCGLAVILQSDYDFVGILLIVSFYFLEKGGRGRLLASGLIMLYSSRRQYGAAALALIPIGLYNGQRGSLKLKYLFYWFYPAHLTALFLFRALALKVFPC